MIRTPAVAGRFYSGDPALLKSDVKLKLDEGCVPSPALGVVSPHAGFMYSGAVAGAVFSHVTIPGRVILIGPNHTGEGHRVSVMTEGTWEMPMGAIEIDSDLARTLCEASPLIQADPRAHRFEHSLETQLPFMQYFRKTFRIVPLCLMRLSYEECREVGRALVASLRTVTDPVLIVASSDMTHYESHASAVTKDRKAIDQILKLDPKGLHETVRDNHITMCGVNPVTVMLLCAKELGATRSELVRYQTSGEVSGDMDHVVGYAGLVIR
ncbi:MAG: AmmeMemoRadiSam system protein B [Nitrospinae bacterium CG11_big_fil_rev_8_21_14_0_20_56_8]|nr:MAG: AmmeMemoRadiSam system protein B [Nitrospinae bacterium CG11_big_fil_rev_8_21_14_0_20_56_8]